jgi:hypothetical protein
MQAAAWEDRESGPVSAGLIQPGSHTSGNKDPGGQYVPASHGPRSQGMWGGWGGSELDRM